MGCGKRTRSECAGTQEGQHIRQQQLPMHASRTASLSDGKDRVFLMKMLNVCLDIFIAGPKTITVVRLTGGNGPHQYHRKERDSHGNDVEVCAKFRKLDGAPKRASQFCV